MPKFTPGDELSERIDRAMVLAGLNGTDLATAVGVSPSYISGLRSGKKGNPSTDVLRKIAAALGVPFPWLLTGEGDNPEFSRFLSQIKTVKESAEAHYDSPEDQQAHFEKVMEDVQAYRAGVNRPAPVLTWSDAGKGLMPAKGAASKTVPLDCPDSSAYWVEVAGDDMEGRILNGDLIAVMPATQPRTGCVVLAKLKDNGLLLRRYTDLGHDRIQLTAYNPIHPSIERRTSDFVFVQPVYSVLRREWT